MSESFKAGSRSGGGIIKCMFLVFGAFLEKYEVIEVSI